MSALLFMIECIAGFAIGILLVSLIAFAVAYSRTDKSISVLSFDTNDLISGYTDRIKRIEAGERYESVFPEVFESLVAIDIKDDKFLCWNGGYEYIKAVLLYSCSAKAYGKALTYLAVSDLLAQNYEAGPDILLEVEMGEETKSKGIPKLGNCMSHELTESFEECTRQISYGSIDVLRKVLLSNMWFTKNWLRIIGPAKTMKFYSDAIDDIYAVSPDAAVYLGVRLYSEIIRMQKNY